MTKKRRVCVSLTDEAYDFMKDFMCCAYIIGTSIKLDTPSKLFEHLLIILKDKHSDDMVIK